MDNAMEARSQRIRHNLRRPLAGRGDLLNETAGNTVPETVPWPEERVVGVVGESEGDYTRSAIIPSTPIRVRDGAAVLCCSGCGCCGESSDSGGDIIETYES